MAEPNVVLNNASPMGYRHCDNDFDFIFVEKTDDDEEDDADSYDYCEDVCSIISNIPGQENGDDVYLSFDGIDDQITLRLPGLKDSALTVPLVLLKDLDEAHEAAKLTQITNLGGVTDLVTTCSDDEHVSEADEEIPLSSPSPNNFVLKKTEDKKADKLELLNLPVSTSKSNLTSTLNKESNDLADTNDSSLVLSTKSKETFSSTIDGNPASRTTAIIILPAARTGKHPSSTTPCFLLTSTKSSQQERKQKEEKKSNGDKNGDNTNAVNKSTSFPVSISRTSNKKRRKRLKTLKKMQAAEKFQQQAAFATLSPPLQGNDSKKFLKQSKEQLYVTPSRCASEKVANIAVSCAMESISSYRKELPCQQGMQ